MNHTKPRQSWLDRAYDGESLLTRILCAAGVAAGTVTMCLIWEGVIL